MIKVIAIIIIGTIISAKLIYEAEWFGYEKLIIGSVIGIDILFLGITNMASTPIETYASNSFLGATPSGFFIGLIPGIWFWGILSIFRIIHLKVKERR